MSQDRDISAAEEIARDLRVVLPLVGVPRWMVGIAATIGVILYVLGKRLAPELAHWWMENRVTPEPPPPLGAHQAPTDIPDGSGWVAPTQGEPGGGSTGGSG
jgi:hypothetical protein